MMSSDLIVLRPTLTTLISGRCTPNEHHPLNPRLIDGEERLILYRRLREDVYVYSRHPSPLTSSGILRSTTTWMCMCFSSASACGMVRGKLHTSCHQDPAAVNAWIMDNMQLPRGGDGQVCARTRRAGGA